MNPAITCLAHFLFDQLQNYELLIDWLLTILFYYHQYNLFLTIEKIHLYLTLLLPPQKPSTPSLTWTFQ